jgi:hypothetical protein
LLRPYRYRFQITNYYIFYGLAYRDFTEFKAYGVDGKLFKWFESYISSRKQCVFINNSKFPFVNPNAGVPQGSVLVPLLFDLG